MALMSIDSSKLGRDFLTRQDEWCSKAQQALADLQQKRCRGSDFTGWYDWPRQGGFAALEEIKTFIRNFPLSYDVVVVVGIGGSYAGTLAVDQALRHSYQSMLKDQQAFSGTGTIPILFAGNNLAEKQLIDLLEVLPRRQMLLNVVSKSGTTTETSVAFRVLRNFMLKHYGEQEAKQRIIITTDPSEGALRRLVETEGFASFAIQPNIGGRYSVLTAVGLLPLALAGHDCDSLLQGADELFSSLGEKDSSSHPVVQVAAFRRIAWELGKLVDVCAFSRPQLAGFVEWWKQLFAESEGKDGKGMLPVGMAYSTDLHSLGQYLQDGYLSMMQTFVYFKQESSHNGMAIERRLRLPKLSMYHDGINYLEGHYLEEINNGAMTAAYQAHSERGVPCLKLEFPCIDAYTLGYMLAAFQVICGISADLLGVNPYDQPGVEAYKRNLFALFGRPGY